MKSEMSVVSPYRPTSITLNQAALGIALSEQMQRNFLLALNYRKSETANETPEERRKRKEGETVKITNWQINFDMRIKRINYFQVNETI